MLARWCVALFGLLAVVAGDGTTEAAVKPYPAAKGCDKALDDYCTDAGCTLCPKSKKYARFDAAAHGSDKKWRCYCEYTLSDDLQKWVDKPKKKGNRDYLDYCTRHAPLEKRLKQCMDGSITPDGSEVKEL